MAEDKKYNAWIISDGRLGRINQCVGVMNKLNADSKIIEIKEIEFSGGVKAYLDKTLGRFPKREDWPDMVISSGREGGNIAVAMKGASNDKLFIAAITSHILSPQFDFMANTKHTDMRSAGFNIEMIGVPHKVTPESIKEGVELWKDRMQPILSSGKPIISVLIGGNINDRFKFDINEARELGATINKEVKRLDAVLLITNSPRITHEVWTELRNEAVKDNNHACVYDYYSFDKNPYPAMLGVADVIAVTGDSISMCCESNVSGKPVYIMCPPSITPTVYENIHSDLYKMGLAKKFEGSLEPYTVTAPKELDAAGRLSKALEKQLEKHFDRLNNPPPERLRF